MPVRLSLLFTNVSHGFVHFLMMLFPTVVLALEREWGMGYSELIGLMFTGQILFGIGALPAGWLADRWSSAGMMVVFLIGAGVAAVLAGLADTPFWLGAGIALMGLFASIYHPVGIPWLIRVALHRGRALGANGVYGAFGFALAPVVAGGLSDLMSWRAAFILPGAVSILLGSALLVLWRRGAIADPRVDAHPIAEVPAESMRRAFVLLTIAMVCAGIVGHTLFLVMPKLVAEGISGYASGIGSVGAMVAVAYLLCGFSGLAGGRLADRYAPGRVYVLAIAAFALLLYAAGMASGLVLVAVALSSAVLNGLYPAAENLLLARFSPARWRATAFGVRSMLTLGSSAASVPLSAFMYERFGGFSALLMLLGTSAAVAALAAQLLPAGTTASAHDAASLQPEAKARPASS